VRGGKEELELQRVLTGTGGWVVKGGGYGGGERRVRGRVLDKEDWDDCEKRCREVRYNEPGGRGGGLRFKQRERTNKKGEGS